MAKKKPQLGIIGLGKMGRPIAEKLLGSGFPVAVYNRSPQPVEELAKEGAVGAKNIPDLVKQLKAPRIAWLMVPAGKTVDSFIGKLSRNLKKGDIIIDGGNSNYKDTILRAEKLKKKGLFYLDCGTSGGVYGGLVGFSLMIGGEKQAYRKVEKTFKTLAQPEGAYGYFGPAGAGHFVKMIHNGIEYAIMQSIGEGLAILKAKEGFKIDLAEAARVWSKGSVIRSWLMDLTEQALRDKSFAKIKDYVEDSGEGRWTVREAEELSVPAPLINLALIERFASRVDENFAHKINAALRNQFGGHAVRKGK